MTQIVGRLFHLAVGDQLADIGGTDGAAFHSHFGNDITKDHEISNSTKGEELENSQDNGNDSVNQDNWDETDNSPRTDNSTKDGEWTPLI